MKEEDEEEEKRVGGSVCFFVLGLVSMLRQLPTRQECGVEKKRKSYTNSLFLWPFVSPPP